MKRRLFWALFLLILGNQAEKAYDYAYAWYKAPPPPFSAEAKKLIYSLEEGQGWALCGTYQDDPALQKGKTFIIINGSGLPFRRSASVRVGNTKDTPALAVICTQSYTAAELRAINSAAEKCLRELTAFALDKTSEKTVEITKETKDTKD